VGLSRRVFKCFKSSNTKLIVLCTFKYLLWDEHVQKFIKIFNWYGIILQPRKHLLHNLGSNMVILSFFRHAQYERKLYIKPRE